ncbi:AAA family ATPase [Sinomonas terrae]|uniref:Nuclease SbcCD subunit C n=1 Tax=Sinomonas terrae TaxID=2908838 RepID=A0ABS9TZC5_9MICC|nr:SMC family ATPase [Sinomonas terrae]MCH6469789.1 SMC family ATPase [Sinomonas terrae]
MRLHRLELAAFGPFATRQSIDFDALAEHGLFLLNGATGAGKTSVLDAVCFALYGGLPGARQGSKSLKSHHADASAEPFVELEFSAQGRRLEVRRTPAWDRPSARSKNGFTSQQASTQLRELVDGDWQALSTRNDEAAGMLRDVLGMDREQFTRVAMLPQGEFAAFLRADPKDREKLLESLFATGRYADVEAELSAMAQEAEASATAAESAARMPLRQLAAELAAHPELAARAELAGHTELAAHPELEGVTADGAVLTEAEEWFRATDASFEVLAERAQAAIARARDEVASARVAEEKCRRAAEDAAELAAARERQERWESKSAEHAARLDRLERARAASALRPELEEDRRAAAACAAAEGELSAALGAAAAVGWAGTDDGELSPGELRTGAGDTRAQAAVLAERIPLEDELDHLTSEQDKAASAARRGRELLSRLDSERSETDRAEAALAAERERIQPLAAARAGDERDEQSARTVVDAVKEYRAAVGQQAAAEQLLLRRRSEALELRGRWLDLRQERLDHTAFELAARLEDGVDCPVCGSPDHPRPAMGDEDPLRFVDREKEAAAAAEAGVESERSAAAGLADARARVAAVIARGGDADPDKAARVLAEATARLQDARAAEGRLEEVSQQIAAIEARRREAAAEREAAATELAVAEATLARLASEIAQRQSDLIEWRVGWPSLSARHSALTALVRALEPLADTAATVAAERAHAARAAAALDAALDGTCFADAEAARSALLTEDEAKVLQSAVESYAAEEQAIAGLLSSAAATRALAAEQSAGLESAPDPAERLEGCQRELARAEAELASAHAARHSAVAARTRCETLHEEFAHALPVVRSARSRADLLGELQRTARGSGDNRLRMSLHRYVLAARLEQVALAATERLAVMSDGRFSLEHSDALAARGAASGLGLEVFDAWTGQRRDPSTLSGGESFMASLALALGLADVVQHEAGGIDIETLFVDEGFGSLDEQTLEQVMEAIEGLRDGGRTVGLVSHVAELKQRIPAQIRVTKGRSGSSVTVVAGGDAL